MHEQPGTTDLAEIKRRFGLTVTSHRIGERDIRIAQVERVDDMIKELYPGAVTTHGDSPVWMITWPATFGLAEYIFWNQSVGGVKVLELGCGTAATGIALKLAGADLVCTDYDPLALALASYNAELNGCHPLETALLDWYQHDLSGNFNLIVGSELVYFEKSFKPLLSVLKRYTAPGGRAILSDQYRPQMGPFLELCREAGFSCHQLNQAVYLPDRNQHVRISIIDKPGRTTAKQ